MNHNPKKSKDSSFYNPLLRLWSFIPQRRRSQLFLLLALMMLASIAEVVSIGAVLPFLSVLIAPEETLSNPFMHQIISRLGSSHPNQLLLPLTLIFVVALIGSGVMRVLLLYMQARIGYAIGADFSIEIYKKTLFQPYSVHISRNSSQVIAGISSKTGSVIGNTVMPALYITSSSITLIAILTALMLIDTVVALSAFAAFGGLYGIIMLLSKKRLEKESRRISIESTHVIKALQEGLGGIRDVLIDGTQYIYCKIYRQAELRLRRSQANISIIGASPRYAIEALGMSLIALLAYWLVVYEGNANGAIPVLGALAVGAQRLLPIFQQLYSSWTAIRGGSASLLDVIELLEQQLPDYANMPPPLPLSFNNSIQLKGVSFSYTGSTPWVLRDINLNIRKGTRVGFVGATGSGKSTLIDILMGLLEPVEGVLEIDGVPLTKENNRSWQKHVAHVPQAIFLSDASVAENIAFGIEPKDIDAYKVTYAATRAQIASSIESWDQGYATVVGERGVRLSGGQRQRIGIARALYKEANILVFDEATSALDSNTELSVMEAINNANKDITMFIIAHRLSTLQKCDFIVELEFGKIKWIGTYSELIANHES